MRRGFAPGTGGGLRRRRLIRWCATLCVCVVLGLLFSTDAGAQTQRQQAPVSVPSVPTIPDINFRISTGDGEPRNFASNLQILFFLTVLSLAPSILIMMTSFTRIVIVLSFLRQALGTQQMPPNQIMIGLSLFLTMYIMLPTWTDINQNALQPYLKSEITQPVAFQRALVPLRAFMFRQTRERDLALMVRLSQSGRAQDGVPTRVLRLSPVRRGRSGGGVGAHVDRRDDVAAVDDLAAAQAAAVRARRRLEPAGDVAGDELPVTTPNGHFVEASLGCRGGSETRPYGTVTHLWNKARQAFGRAMW